MQFERFYSLNQSAWFAHLHRVGFQRSLTNLGICGGIDVNVSRMPIHSLRRCSNTSYGYEIDMGCSLKGSTASRKV